MSLKRGFDGAQDSTQPQFGATANPSSAAGRASFASFNGLGGGNPLAFGTTSSLGAGNKPTGSAPLFGSMNGLGSGGGRADAAAPLGAVAAPQVGAAPPGGGGGQDLQSTGILPKVKALLPENGYSKNPSSFF